MKKIVLIGLVLIGSLASRAQVKFGAKAGANFYNLTGDDATGITDEKLKSKVGLHLGVLANIPVSSMFSVQPELLYSQEGAKEKGEESGTSYKVNYNLNYLNIPVLAQYNNPSGFYAETGPQIGILMSAKVKVEVEGEDEEEEDIKDEMKGSNFSWAFGAGFKTKSGLGFGARYTLGLGGIADDDEVDLKSSGFGIGIFYMFGGSKDGAKK